MTDVQLSQNGEFWVGRFRAMASPCEIHLEVQQRTQAAELVQLAQAEAQRIETLFSRYLEGNIIHRINTSAGNPIEVDDETARMLDFADQCHQLSDGLFDVTSGVLRKAWHFDGSDKIPTLDDIKQLLGHIGWQRVSWEKPYITLPVGMQIDFGGIGKEYAVDRTAAILRQHSQVSLLVNYGGDLHATDAPVSTGAWSVGVESAIESKVAVKSLQLKRGALTTSGDAQRYLLKAGVRYGHVLNPLTGWPAPDAPSSVTVAGNTCTETGILSTLALLQGADAERFLDEQGVTYWCQRS